MSSERFPMHAFAFLTASTFAAGTLAAKADAARASEGEPVKGLLEGAITPARSVLKVTVIDRDVPQNPMADEVAVIEVPALVSADGSRYAVELPPGTYDLRVELTGGRIVEGADLRLGGPAAEAGPITSRDRKRIADIAMRTRTWSNEKEIIAIEGAAERARVLVKLVRTNPTSYDREYGEPVAVVRFEVWNFRKYTGSWRRERKVKVLRRRLSPKRRGRPSSALEFDPALGGVDVEPGGVTRRDLDFTPAATADTPTQAPQPPPPAVR